jgi:hypothetical protein
MTPASPSEPEEQLPLEQQVALEAWGIILMLVRQLRAVEDENERLRERLRTAWW